MRMRTLLTDADADNVGRLLPNLGRREGVGKEDIFLNVA